MKLTKEQVQKWNAKMSNGFEFDVKSYFYTGEKEAHKYIELNSDQLLEVKLMYYPNGIMQQPTLHLSVWQKEGSGMMKSYGLGKWIKIGTVQNQKKFSVLQTLTGEIDDNEMIKLA